MKFSGEIEDGTSIKSLNLVAIRGLGGGLRSPSALSERRFALSESF